MTAMFLCDTEWRPGCECSKGDVVREFVGKFSPSLCSHPCGIALLLSFCFSPELHSVYASNMPQNVYWTTQQKGALLQTRFDVLILVWELRSDRRVELCDAGDCLDFRHRNLVYCPIREPNSCISYTRLGWAANRQLFYLTPWAHTRADCGAARKKKSIGVHRQQSNYDEPKVFASYYICSFLIMPLLVLHAKLVFKSAHQ